MSITSAQAISLLENVLFESSTLAAANAAQWVSISQADTASTVISDVATAMAGTAEAGIAEQVVRYYEGALGREPTIQEVAYYVHIAEAGLSATQVAQGAGAVSQASWNQIASYFAASPEFHSLYGGTDSAVVSALYQNILGRTPSAAESAYYQKVLDGGTSVSTVVQYFVTSPEFQDQADAKIEAMLAATGVTAATGVSPPVGVPSIGNGVSVVDLNSSAGAGAVTITATTTATATTSLTLANLGGAGVVTTTSSATASPSVITIAPLTTAGLVAITITGTTKAVLFTEGSSTESLHFTAVSGSGADLVYTSAGAAQTVAVTSGFTFEIPPGTGSVELTGIQPGLVFTLTHV